MELSMNIHEGKEVHNNLKMDPSKEERTYLNTEDYCRISTIT